MQIRVHGLAPREGETAFAFLVLRLATPVDRDGLIDLIGQLAPLVPDAASFAAEVPEDCEAAMRLIGIPWSPPADAAAFDVQRQLIDGAGLHGIEEAWFFQTGTSLPMIAEEDDADEEDEDDDDEDDDADDEAEAGEADVDDADDADDADDDDDEDEDEDEEEDDEDGEDDGMDASWSHGPPPQVSAVRFPVDGYPAILEDLDWEDFGIAVKLGGPWTSGETTVLLGFHAMWLTPYGGRYRNARVTIDPVHHAAHFWVDRFAVSCSAHEQVHHLLWIVSKLDEITPVVHARFGGATIGQKFGNLAGDLGEPVVLGGNPLLAIYAREGDVGVDAWIASQTAWSPDEVAPMLRELAIDLVTQRDPRPAAPDPRAQAVLDGDAASDDDEVDAMFEAAGLGVGEADHEAAAPAVPARAAGAACAAAPGRAAAPARVPRQARPPRGRGAAPGARDRGEVRAPPHRGRLDPGRDARSRQRPGDDPDPRDHADRQRARRDRQGRPGHRHRARARHDRRPARDPGAVEPDRRARGAQRRAPRPRGAGAGVVHGRRHRAAGAGGRGVRGAAPHAARPQRRRRRGHAPRGLQRAGGPELAGSP